MGLNWNPEVSKTESTFANEKTNTIKLRLERDNIDSHVSAISADIFVDQTHFKDAQSMRINYRAIKNICSFIIYAKT